MTDSSGALAALKAQRAERAKAAHDAADAQRVVDMTAVLELEDRHGANAVKVIHLPETPGLPTLIVVRRAYPPEFKRYRATQTLTKKNQVDLGAVNSAAEMLADLVVIYPDAETYARVRETFGGVHAQAGLESAKLAEGKADDDEKNS